MLVMILFSVCPPLTIGLVVYFRAGKVSQTNPDKLGGVYIRAYIAPALILVAGIAAVRHAAVEMTAGWGTFGVAVVGYWLIIIGLVSALSATLAIVIGRVVRYFRAQATQP